MLQQCIHSCSVQSSCSIGIAGLWKDVIVGNRLLCPDGHHENTVWTFGIQSGPIWGHVGMQCFWQNAFLLMRIQNMIA